MDLVHRAFGHLVSAAWAGRLAYLAAAAGAFLAGLYLVRTHDTFFHLATGRAIVELGHVPRTDLFSFSARGAPWTNHSAGFQLLLHSWHTAFGFVGISIWQGLVALSLFVLAGWTVPRGERAYGCVVALVPFVFYREVLEARPHALGFVCLSLLLVIVGRAPQGPRRLQALVWLSTYALFCSVHGSHLLALFVSALAALFALVGRRLPEFGRWLLLLIGSLALAFWLQPEAFSQGSQHLSSEFLEVNVAEWRPLSAEDLLTNAKGIAYLGCLALSLMGALAACKAPRGAPPSRLVLTLLAAFMLFSLSSRRMLALFLFGVAPLWLPFATQAVALLLEQSSALVWRRGVVGLALAALLAHLTWSHEPFKLGMGLDEARFPSRAVARLRQPDAPQRVYNAYNFGAYLIWMRTPSAGVFVDGRAITVYPAELLAAFERAYDDMRVFELLRARFAIDGVLMPHASPRVRLLLRHLAASPDWLELQRDELSVLYALRARSSEESKRAVPRASQETTP